MTDENTTYVANGRRAWGKGNHETEAVQQMAARFSDFQDEEEIEIVKMKGFKEIRGPEILADEILNTEKLLVDGDTLKKVKDAMGQAELAAEAALVNGEEVEE